MTLFYIVAGFAALITVGLMIRPLIAGTGRADALEDNDTAVYRDQLAELERDLARGTINEDEAEGARIEISRRLIAAANRVEADGALSPAPQGRSGMVAGMSLIGLPALAAVVYLAVGTPGAPDQPLASRPAANPHVAGGVPTRPTQEQMEERLASQMPPAPDAGGEEEFSGLIARLEQMVETRPDDPEGRRMLADGYLRLQRWGDAWRAYRDLIGLLGDTADAEIVAAQAEAMVLSAGGYVSPEAEEVIDRALTLDPDSHIARYYQGLSLAQAGDLDAAIPLWQKLRSEAPANAPWLEWLDTMLAEAVAMRDGGPVAAPSGPNPTREQIEAADQMSPEERMAMIDGMVQRLADRLATEGGTIDDWGRLIASYAQLDRTDEARKAFDDAMAVFDSGPEADALRAHAARLGVIDAPADTGTTAPGPTAEDIAAAQSMPAEERAAMVEGMVQRLEERLTSDGGTAEEWYRLMNSYVQLDRKDDAARVYGLAAVALENDPSAGFLREQALLLGVITQ